MSESLLKFIGLVVSAFRIDLGATNFFLRGHEIAEGREEGVIDVDFEGDDEEDWREARDPDERSESFLKANGEGHERLHEDDAEKESVNDNVPETL